MKRTVLVIAMSILPIGSVHAADSHGDKRHHEAHVHGSGKLSLVSMDRQLMIELEMPAYDIVGFEHTPKTEAQKASVKQAIEFLKMHNYNIKLPERANCEPSGTVAVETPLAIDHDQHDKHEHEEQEEHEHEEHKEHEHEEHGHDNHKHDHEGMHSEFHVVYNFTCSNPGELSSVEVLTFKQFNNMEQLVSQGVTENGQFSQILSPEARLFNLN